MFRGAEVGLVVVYRRRALDLLEVAAAFITEDVLRRILTFALNAQPQKLCPALSTKLRALTVLEPARCAVHGRFPRGQGSGLQGKKLRTGKNVRNQQRRHSGGRMLELRFRVRMERRLACAGESSTTSTLKGAFVKKLAVGMDRRLYFFLPDDGASRNRGRSGLTKRGRSVRSCALLREGSIFERR